MIEPIEELMTYYKVRGVGRTGRFDFSVRHYIHYTPEEIIKIMTDAYTCITTVNFHGEYKKQLIMILYQTAKTDMIRQLEVNGAPIPKIYYEIEKAYNNIITSL